MAGWLCVWAGLPVGAVVLGSSVEVVGWHTLQKRAAQGGMRAVSVGKKKRIGSCIDKCLDDAC